MAGCAYSGVDGDDYVRANVAIFDEVPRFPAASLLGRVSTPYRATEPGPVVGYGTRFDLRLPLEAEGDEVAAFYEEGLRPGWTLVERLDGPVVNFRRGDASLSINVESWRAHRLEIAIDHARFAHA
jgi:hypothetical protein